MRSRDSLLRLNRFKVEDCRRQVSDMDMMISDLMRKHDDLDNHVKFEEQRTGVSDPANVNYSMAAKSVRGRRDNILRTVAELRDQHEAMIERLKDAEADLRKVEMLVEKEAPAKVAVAPAVAAASILAAAR
ncbi:MAG TPA: flagellar export protein FliJ [Aestuariivirga sp.]|jgi:flagellar FliJ protein